VPIAQAPGIRVLAVEVPQVVLDLTFIWVSKLLSVFESEKENAEKRGFGVGSSIARSLVRASVVTTNARFPAAFSGGLYRGRMSAVGRPLRNKSCSCRTREEFAVYGSSGGYGPNSFGIPQKKRAVGRFGVETHRRRDGSTPALKNPG
jgi:hypothetical protein